MAEHDHAIVVGIANYPGMRDLQGPALDALRFARWLRSTDGGGVPAEQVRLVFTGSCRFSPRRPSRVDHARPTSLDFEDAYNQLVGRPRPAQLAGRLGRRLYLYFSGHGFESSDGVDRALYSARATEGNYNHIPVTHFARGIWQEALFEEIVLVMDCCRDIEPWKFIYPPAVPFVAKPGAAAKSRLYRALATGYGRKAIEAQADPLPDGEPGGVFTWALIEALKGARALDGGQVTSQAVKNFIEQLWPDLAARYGCPEKTDLSPEQGGDFVWLVRPSDAKPESEGTAVFFSGAGRPDGTLVLVFGGLPPVPTRKLSLTNGMVETRLPPGYFKVTMGEAGPSQLFEVRGDRVDVRFS